LKECYKHQRHALYDILQSLDGQGNVYDITFSYQKNSYDNGLNNLDAQITYLTSGEQQENLAFHLLEYSDTEDLTLSVDYVQELFTAPGISSLLFHMHALLGACHNGPQLLVEELPYMSAAERQELLEAFNDTAGGLSPGPNAGKPL
jgi:non-ribosomal peptide synthetase component F